MKVESCGINLVILSVSSHPHLSPSSPMPLPLSPREILCRTAIHARIVASTNHYRLAYRTLMEIGMRSPFSLFFFFSFGVKPIDYLVHTALLPSCNRTYEGLNGFSKAGTPPFPIQSRYGSLDLLSVVLRLYTVWSLVGRTARQSLRQSLRMRRFSTEKCHFPLFVDAAALQT